MKVIFETVGNKITFKCEPNDKVVLKNDRRAKEMSRADAIKWFFDGISMGDSIEVEECAYGLFDTIVGGTTIMTEQI